LHAGKHKKVMCITTKAVRAVRRKHKLYSRYKDSKHPAYIKASAVAKKETKRAKRNFETKLCENIKKDTKSFYAYVRSQSKSKVKVGPLIGESGSTVNDNKEMAEVLNNYFSSVYTQEDASSIPEPEKIFFW